MLLMLAISSKIIGKSNHDGGNCAKDDIYEEDELEKDNTAAIISLTLSNTYTSFESSRFIFNFHLHKIIMF